MSNIKAIITDLDDTLLSPDKEISKEFYNTLSDLRERNIIFSFITGRPKYAIKRFIDELDIAYPVVSCNGAIIFNQEEVILKHSFKIYKLKNVLLKAASLGLTVLYYTDDIEYSLTETDWVKVRVNKGRYFPVRELSDTEWENIECEKVNIMSDGLNDEFLSIKKVIEELSQDVSLSMYGANGCEIVAKNVNKALGLKEFSKLVNVPVNEIMAIGDNANDHEMLQCAGLGVAVNNATKETKSFADYISSNSYTEGVIEAINKHVLEVK